MRDGLGWALNHCWITTVSSTAGSDILRNSKKYLKYWGVTENTFCRALRHDGWWTGRLSTISICILWCRRSWMGSDILQSKEDWRLKTEELENFVLCYRILPYKIPYLIAYPKSKTVFLDNIRVETFYPLITSQQSIEKNRFSFFRRENSSEDQVTCKEKFIWSDTNICRGIRSFTNRSLPMVTAGSKSNLRTDASHTYFHMYYLPNSVSVQRPRGDHWGSSMSRLWRKYLER